MGTRFRLMDSTTLDANGAGSASIAARGDITVRHVRAAVRPAPGALRTVLQPEAVTFLNGEEFENTSAGAADTSDTVFEMEAGETLRCDWTGGDPGATAILTVRGVWGGVS